MGQDILITVGTASLVFALVGYFQRDMNINNAKKLRKGLQGKYAFSHPFGYGLTVFLVSVGIAKIFSDLLSLVGWNWMNNWTFMYTCLAGGSILQVWSILQAKKHKDDPEPVL